MSLRRAPRPAGRALRCVVAAAVAALAACGSPAPDAHDHHDAVVTAVESGLGDARTALLALEAWRDGDATTAYAAVTLREAATSVEGATGGLTALTPPPSGDGLQARAEGLLSDAGDAVVAARVAVERTDRAAAADTSRSLAEAADALDRLAEELG